MDGRKTSGPYRLSERIKKLSKPKGLFLLIDALRYDTLSDPVARIFLFPNLSRLAERGFVRKVVTNAQSTQFVMPSLFSLTYPLDHGGYDNGVRERPQSFVESIKEEGFETHLLASCNQLGVATGYARGFDTVRTTSDFRILLEQRISRTLRFLLDPANAGESADNKKRAGEELVLLLDGIQDMINAHDNTIWPDKLRRLNSRVALGCAAERQLLDQDPAAVFEKLCGIAPGIYWRFLGQKKPGGIRLFWHRAMESVRWRSRKWIAKQTLWPFLVMSHFPVILGDIINPLCKLVEQRADKQWFVHMHMMDVHDCRSISRPLHILNRMRFLPRWLVGRLRGYTKRRWLYDTAIMYVDDLLGRLFDTLEKTGQLDNTVILVTGDHGLYYAESPRTKIQIGSRTHYEDIEVPLLLANANRVCSEDGMVDSMGVTATFIDALNVPPHISFKGISALHGGRPCVISENCGNGNADLAHRDIFFTVTTLSHRLMVVLRGPNLEVDKLYDRRLDPRETDNIAGDSAQQPIIQEMVNLLRTERAEIFELRRKHDNAA